MKKNVIFDKTYSYFLVILLAFLIISVFSSVLKSITCKCFNVSFLSYFSPKSLLHFCQMHITTSFSKASFTVTWLCILFNFFINSNNLGLSVWFYAFCIPNQPVFSPCLGRSRNIRGCVCQGVNKIWIQFLSGSSDLMFWYLEGCLLQSKCLLIITLKLH